MAYSSEPAVRGFVPPQNEEERLLMRRVEELCRTAQNRGVPRYTGFLSDREQSLARAAANRAECSCIRFQGGYDGAERAVFCVEPPDSWSEEPVTALRMQAMGTPLPGHRDYLGAVLGLGLERACVGDILQDPGDAAVFYAFVLEDKAELIAAELTSAGRCPVRVSLWGTVPESVLQGPERQLQQATVPSLRADTVLSAMLHTSRSKAAELISAGRVEINHLPLHAASEAVYEKDLFTVRGQGRFRLAEIGGKSRKDRIFITYFQY